MVDVALDVGPDVGVNDPREPTLAREFGLRFLDVVCAVSAIIVLVPVLLILAVGVWLQDGGSPLFVQRRIGRGGRPFRCLKFRSMCPASNERLQHHLATNAAARLEWEVTHKLRDDPRVTPLGRLLRSSSLDELPQLFNVVAGSMSLVGPRPIIEQEIPRYGRYFRQYCAVRPGITGLWQVSGRNDVSYRRRIVLDVVYVRRKSLRMNMIVLGRTVPAVIARRGCY